MAIGSDVGKTFLFGESSPSFTTQQAQVGDQGPIDVLGGALDDIQATDDLTGEYYTQWINAKNFARNAWKRYGIDVTNPNPESEEEIRLAQMFQKNVAGIKTLGNSLARGRENEKAIMARQLVDPNVVATGTPGQITGARDFVQTGLTDQDKAVSSRVGRSVNTKQERDQLNQERDQYLTGLLSELEATEDEGQRLALAERINALSNISATYDPTQALNRQQRERLYQRKRGGQNIDFANDLWVKAKQDFFDRSGNITEQIQNIPNVLSATYVTRKDGSGNDVPYMEVIVEEPGRNLQKQILVNMNDDNEGYRNFLGILQAAEGFKDLEIDSAFLPKEQRFESTGQDFTNFVGSMRELLGKEDKRSWWSRNAPQWLGGGGKAENTKILNESLQRALTEQGLKMPETKTSQGGEPINSIELDTELGTPVLEVTFIKDGKEKSATIELSNEFLDRFVGVNSISMFNVREPGVGTQSAQPPVGTIDQLPD